MPMSVKLSVYNLDLDPRYGYLVVFLSTLFWFGVRSLISWHGLPRSVRSVDLWRWQNLAISWMHALISAVWVLYCFAVFKDLRDVLTTYSNNTMYMLISFSTGYFVYDQLDIILSKKLLQNWEVSLHHVGVLLIFFYHLHYRIFVAHCVIALFTEVNSVFLHMRKLLQMVQYAGHWIYRVVALMNVTTFLTFRLGAIFAIVYSVYQLGPYMTWFHWSVLTSAMVVMVVINLVLLMRIIKSDFIKKRARMENKDTSSRNGFSNNNTKTNHNYAN